MDMSSHPPLHEWMDGRLPETAAADARAHVDGCPLCREEHRRLSLLRGGFQSIIARSQPLAISPYFETRFWAQVRQRKEGAGSWRGVLRPALSAVGLAALALILAWPRIIPRRNPSVDFVSASLTLARVEARSAEADRAAERLLDNVF